MCNKYTLLTDNDEIANSRLTEENQSHAFKFFTNKEFQNHLKCPLSGFLHTALKLNDEFLCLICQVNTY